MKKRGLKAVIIALSMVMLSVISGCGGGDKEESYRNIQVYEVDGTAEVERDVVGVLEAYANMMLQNQDNVSVFFDSSMQMKLDEDKYILLEPGTKIRLVAEGDSEDSKTQIFLEEGAIVCNLENSLSEDASFEVNTPNSTMAVRGTTFRVALEYDEGGNSYTAVGVYEGEVESYLIYPNGEVAEKSVSIPAGKEVQVKGTEEDSMYIVTDQEISYDELKGVTLDFLNVILEKGTELSITKEEVQTYIEVLKALEEVPVTEETEVVEETESETQESEESEPEPESESEVEEEPEPEPSETIEEVTETESSEVVEEDTSSTETTTPPSGGSSSGGSSSGGSSSGGTQTPATYTVTFTCNGKTFATQSVTSGQCATEPLLMPTSAGYWNFDFTQTISANTTVEWVDESAT